MLTNIEYLKAVDSALFTPEPLRAYVPGMRCMFQYTIHTHTHTHTHTHIIGVDSPKAWGRLSNTLATH